MKGFALVREGRGLKKVPHDSNDETGRVPPTTKDGEDVWNWTSVETSADALIARRNGFLESRGQTASAPERKSKAKGEGK